MTEFDTETIAPKGSITRYCPYCGKEVTPKEQWDGTSLIMVTACTCEESIKARDILAQIRKLEYQLPTPHFHVAEAIIKW